jgi:hypothetical protein
MAPHETLLFIRCNWPVSELLTDFRRERAAADGADLPLTTPSAVERPAAFRDGPDLMANERIASYGAAGGVRVSSEPQANLKTARDSRLAP